MKILHVFPFFSLKHAGGTVDFVYKLTSAQFNQGHEVAVYTGDFKLDKEYKDSLKGVKVLTFKSWLNFGFYLMPDMIRQVKINLIEFDIIHLHCYRSFQNMVIHHYAKKYNIPYVLDAHGSIPKFSRKKRLKTLFDIIYGYKILNNASRILAESKTSVEAYKQSGIKRNDIVLFSPPFATEEFSCLPKTGEFRKKYNIKTKNIVMFFGRINYIKGLDFLVAAFSELVKHRQDAILVMVGSDDGYKHALIQMIERLGLDGKVLFTGFISMEDKLRALIDANVVVQVSRYEEGAWAPFEAVLCGTPIIVTGHTGAGEDVKRIDAGYLVELDNKADLCEKIEYVLDNQDLAKEKANKAKIYIENNMSMKNRLREYDELYKVCIEEKKSAH
ncbi:glycosyltransferase [bacterium]|nr:MAG: glycosyltransferase [bacterium]